MEDLPRHAADIDCYRCYWDRICLYADESVAGREFFSLSPQKTKYGQLLLDASPAEQIHTILTSLTTPPTPWTWLHDKSVQSLRSALLKRNLPYTEDDIVELSLGLRAPGVAWWRGFDPGILTAVERYVKSHGLPSPLRKVLASCVETCEERMEQGNAAQSSLRRIRKILGDEAAVLYRGEIWSNAVINDVQDLAVDQRRSWSKLLSHCQCTTGGSPSAKWLKSARVLLDAVGADDFVQRLVVWLPLVDQRPPIDANEPPRSGNPLAFFEPHPLTIIEPHQELLKGLAWCASLHESRDLARALTALALSAYKKVPGIGPRAVKVGNACVYALGSMPGMDGVGQLALLKVKVKFGTAQKLIEKALTQSAERLGMPRDEIEELAVTSYGLEEVGLRRETLGDFTCELLVEADGSTELRWLKADGRVQKSVPASVKSDFADELKELKAAAKDIEKMLPAQKERIDNLFLAQKSWPLAQWRERYLNHPLVGILARRLIWRFARGADVPTGPVIIGIWHSDKLVDAADQPLELPDETRVELWHPIGRPADEIAGWRGFLERHEIRQPFKQAHREVYVLTPAEENTRVYSNRYAGHVLKQHQFNALCGARGWKNKLRLMVDDTYPPASRYLPQWGLRAEFWIEGAGDNYGVDTNESGTYLYLTTDQVRFYALDAAQRQAHAAGGGYGRHWGAAGDDEPLPLSEVPPLVFSEIMRDVDLFVGVASVGNDPTWNDGGPNGRYVDYWHSYSFGELTETAKTRRQVLERLVPRLKIADRCSFDDRFLVVRGYLKTYKIHLGSGNILMSPNDQYLCIVPRQANAAGASDKVFLPFEGDNVLSVILSKALLLAEDSKIKDQSITAQIGRS